MKLIVTLIITAAAATLVWHTLIEPTRALLKSNTERIERAINSHK